MTSIGRRKPQHPVSPEAKFSPPAKSFGVDPEAAERALRAFLRNEHGEKRPWCTCLSVRGWIFDVQIGVYLHSDPTCWKPSKAYYEAAARAGILGEPVLR